MTSIRCPECSTLVSGSSQNCPQCNFPVSKLRGLSAAILTKNAERVAGLIQLGADVNAVDRNDRTPLMTAALIDDSEIAEMLLAAGARPQFVNNAGETALSVAKSREVERLIRRAIVVSKFQRATQTEPPPQKVTVQEEPAIQFDHSIMLTEIPPPQNNQVTPIDVQLNDELFELQNHKVPEELPEPFLFEEAPPTQFNKVMPVDIQLNEELFEVQNHQPIEVYQEVAQTKQSFPRPGKPNYFFAAIIGCSLLLLFMALTWPQYTRSAIPQAIESPKPVKQIVKQEPEKEPPVLKNEIEVAQEPQPVEAIPEAPVKNVVIPSSPKKKQIGDEEKIRLARALNSQGYSLIKQGKLGEAIPVLERSLRSFPKDSKDAHYGYALFNLAVAWRKAGRPDLAIPILEKRMKIEDQRNVVARELYAARQEAIDAGFGSFKN